MKPMFFSWWQHYLVSSPLDFIDSRNECLSNSVLLCLFPSAVIAVFLLFLYIRPIHCSLLCCALESKSGCLTND